MNAIYQGVKVFFVLSAIVFVFALIYSGFSIADRNDACQQKGGVLVKTGVDGYVCIDRSAVK